MSRNDVIYVACALLFLLSIITLYRAERSAQSRKRAFDVVMLGIWIGLGGIMLQGDPASKNLAFVLLLLQAVLVVMLRNVHLVAKKKEHPEHLSTSKTDR